MDLSAMKESDLEMLESYLDDELSALETEALLRRLSDDPALSAALKELTAQRDLRRAVFATFEPSEISVNRVIATVERKVDGHMIWAERARGLRVLSGVAATLLLGFLGGYVFHAGNAAQHSAPGLASNNIAAPMNTVASTGTQSGQREIVFPNRPPSFVTYPTMTGTPVPTGSENFASYNVAVTDDAGNIIGVQRFPTLQQAQEFQNDIGRLRQQSKQLQKGGVKLISDEF
jgi:hypothetical protein